MAKPTETQSDPADIEIFLAHGDREATVSPYGASLRGYYQRSPDGSLQEIASLYSGAKPPKAPVRARPMRMGTFEVGQKIGGQGDVVIPFPGRVRDGHYTFAGQDFQLERNDHEGPNAIHGLLRSVVWATEENTETSVRFATRLDADQYATRGYPFSLTAEVTYRLDSDGLTCSFVIKNVGDNPAPVGAGFHPYFTTGSSLIDVDELHVPMDAMLEMNDDLLPTGRILPVEGTDFDFRSPHEVGSTRLNTCFLQPQRGGDGKLRIQMRQPDTHRTVRVWMDEAFDYVVLYSGDPLPPDHRRRCLAIEPMTCGSDAFNHHDWGLATLNPGEALTGAWGVECEG